MVCWLHAFQKWRHVKKIISGSSQFEHYQPWISLCEAVYLAGVRHLLGRDEGTGAWLFRGETWSRTTEARRIGNELGLPHNLVRHSPWLGGQKRANIVEENSISRQNTALKMTPSVNLAEKKSEKQSCSSKALCHINLMFFQMRSTHPVNQQNVYTC